jgi:hypothetical protein
MYRHPIDNRAWVHAAIRIIAISGLVGILCWRLTWL